MIQETGPNHPTSLYIYTDQNSYEPLARIDKRSNEPERVMYFHTDLNGCPEELTDANGELLWECSFQLWGKRIHEIEHESIEQNLRYQGQYLDRETGLHYNTFRYYDPDIGRFTQPDPIGLLGGFNLYQYAPNGLTWIDPWGWSCWSTSRKKFWKNEAKNNPSMYSKKNIELMKEGKAPKLQVEVINRKSGKEEIIDVRMELHHKDIPQRVGGENVHNHDNLAKLTPWEHEAVDPYRHTGYDVINIVKDVDKW